MSFSRRFEFYVNNEKENFNRYKNINIDVIGNFICKYKKHLLRVFISMFFLIAVLNQNINIVWASETDNKENSGSDIDLSGLDEFDFSDIQKILEQNGGISDISFRQIVEKLIKGDTEDIFTVIIDLIKNQLFLQIDENKQALTQVVLIAIVAAIFTNFSDVFSKSGISQLSFYITYLLLITLLCTAFATIMQISSEMVKLLVSFMKALIPAYFLAVAFVGGTVTSMSFYQFTLILITVLEAVLLYLVLPAIQVYVLIIFINNLSKEDVLSKLAELLKIVIDWALKTVFGAMLGFGVIQSLILPYIDNLKTNAVQKAISAIPGIGGGVSAVSEVIMGTGIIIKNGIGVAGLIVVILLAIIPIIKLVILALLYYGACAVIQPMSDKRIVESITAVANGTAMALKATALAALLLILTIAIICISTNVVR